MRRTFIRTMSIRYNCPKYGNSTQKTLIYARAHTHIQVGRAPRNCERNPHGAPIGELLYLNGLEEKRRKEAMLEAEKEEARRQAEAHHST
eukprot:scaffold32668_cov24-Tisochrysis_lutea.AAC.3